jgi:hypothetical protein
MVSSKVSQSPDQAKRSTYKFSGVSVKSHVLSCDDVRGEVSPLTYICLADLLKERGWKEGDEITLSEDAERLFQRNNARVFLRILRNHLDEAMSCTA